MGEKAEVFTSPAVAEKVGAALDAVTGALEGLRSATVGAEPVEAVLRRLAETAVFALPDADAVSVTRLDPTAPRTVVSTDDLVMRIDEEQYAADRGPCLEAGRVREPVRAVVGDHAAVWPEFTAAAEQAGIRAYLSVPLIVEDAGPGELVGSFNVYSYRAEAFDPFDEKLMRLLTTAASAAIGNARRWRAAADTVGQLETALVSRSVIDQAKGVLMALHRITSEEAFHRLVERSQRTNTKLSDVADDLMRSVTADR
jgi:AmiR/NasT family two-component response regulator